MHVALPKPRAGGKPGPAEQRLGFLAAGRDTALGYVGGYLITTPRGRPLEFHYTNPLEPSATHRILYGAELEPYIYESLIGMGLLQQSAVEPELVITDQPLILPHRARCAVPLVCVARGPAAGARGSAGPALPEIATHPDFPGDREFLSRIIHHASPGLDLREPFDRIWEALREVLGGPKRAAA